MSQVQPVTQMADEKKLLNFHFLALSTADIYIEQYNINIGTSLTVHKILQA